MKRNEFFAALGVSAGTIMFAPFLVSCSKSSMDSTEPPGGGGGVPVDFTLDLTQPANANLNSNGGSLLKSGVIVARTSTGDFIAVASACTHQGYILVFESANNQFHCNNHGSNFATGGSVINGPATAALKKYNAVLTGTSLRVYA
jgi:cytochrome b6-f complex iron-sulfur subunit